MCAFFAFKHFFEMDYCYLKVCTLNLTDEFKPPIRSRSNKEIASIVASPHKWNEKAVKIAQEEIIIRKIEAKEIRQVRYLENKKERIEASKLANEKFSFFTLAPEQAFIDWNEVFLFFFSWELEKDGYAKKAAFQRYYRPVVLLVFVILFFFFW